MGQAKDQDLFAPVPARLRARLVERLKLLVDYQRTQEWEKEYDLLSILVTQGESKADHLKRLRRSSAEGLGMELIDPAYCWLVLCVIIPPARTNKKHEVC